MSDSPDLELPFHAALKLLKPQLIHSLGSSLGYSKARETIDQMIEQNDPEVNLKLWSMMQDLTNTPRLHKEDIIRETQVFVRRNGLTHTPIVLGYGGAMVMHGLRESTSDLDFDVPLTVMAWLRMKHKAPIREGLVGMCSDISPIISIHPALWGDSEVVMVDGILCYNLTTLRKHKEFLRDHPDRMSRKRPQDILDIAAIDAAIAQTA